MTRFVSVLVLAAVVGSSVSCSRTGPKPLVVGMELAYPPFEMTDAKGRPAGISVDLAKAMAAYLGRPLKIENLPFDGLIPALKTGSIDLILSSMTDTEERRQSIDFSQPYLNTGLAILAAKDAPVQRVEDLNQPGRRVAVKLGTTGELYAKDHLPNAEITALKEESACALEVAQGKADAFLYDQMSVYNNWKKHAETTRPILEPFRREAWAIGIRKGNDDLRADVNRFLDAFRAANGFDGLADMHLGEMKKAFQQFGTSFVF